MNLLKKIWSLLTGLFGPRRTSQFSGIVLLESSIDATTALKENELVVIGTAQKHKWLQFVCPCGCGETQALNLMRSHHPFWTIEIHSDQTLTLYPSVDAQKCGAHFWVRRNKVVWC